MPEDPASPTRTAPSRLNLLGQFVLIPLVVVAIGISVFLLFGLVAREEATAQQYLREIHSGSASRRWQAAWELARVLNHGGAAADPALVPQMIAALEEARDDDPKVRRYLIRALGYLRDPRALPALIQGLEDEDADTRLWAAESLEALGDAAAAGPLTALLGDEDPGVRKQVVHALGTLGASGSSDAIQPLLHDPVADVRWNAALALARGGNRAGIPVLLEMIDRSRLQATPGLRPDQEEVAMVTALSALSALRVEEARPSMEKLLSADDSLRVRQAADAALAGMTQP